MISAAHKASNETGNVVFFRSRVVPDADAFEIKPVCQVLKLIRPELQKTKGDIDLIFKAARLIKPETLLLQHVESEPFPWHEFGFGAVSKQSALSFICEDGSEIKLNPSEIPTLTDAFQIHSVDSGQNETIAHENAPLEFAYNKIGEQIFVTSEVDPFHPDEWILFQRRVLSRFYESRAQATAALHAFVIDSGVNFACEAKIVTRSFNFRGFEYKKYFFDAVFGLYYVETPHADQALCASICEELNERVVPAKRRSFFESVELESEARKTEASIPEPIVSDFALLLGSIAGGAMLLATFTMMVINSGAFA